MNAHVNNESAEYLTAYLWYRRTTMENLPRCSSVPIWKLWANRVQLRAYPGGCLANSSSIRNLYGLLTVKLYIVCFLTVDRPQNPLCEETKSEISETRLRYKKSPALFISTRLSATLRGLSSIPLRNLAEVYTSTKGTFVGQRHISRIYSREKCFPPQSSWILSKAKFTFYVT